MGVTEMRKALVALTLIVLTVGRAAAQNCQHANDQVRDSLRLLLLHPMAGIRDEKTAVELGVSPRA